MYDIAGKLFKAMIGKVQQFVERNKVDIQTIGAKPVKNLEYVDVTPKNSQKESYKVLDYGSSKRVTLPKKTVDKWYQRDLRAVDIRVIQNPSDPNDERLLIKPIYGDEDGD